MALTSWCGWKACKKRELLSLIGSLSHACKVVRAGRFFLRRFIELSTTTRHLNRFIRLSRSARSDIEWWYQYCARWNGVAMMSEVRPDFEVLIVSNESGSLGCGDINGEEWFQLKWEGLGMLSLQSITLKELLPIVIAVSQRWSRKTVWTQCDNAAVVAVVNSGSCREPEVMHLHRCLAFLLANHSFYMMAMHISGTENLALSRDRLSIFYSSFPQVKEEPVEIPTHTSEHLLCQYVSHLTLLKLSHNTIKSYLAAVRHLHIEEGLADPEISKMARLEQVLRGIKATHARCKQKGKPRLPISVKLLSKLKESWQREASQDLEMLWAAAALCFFGFLRSGVLTVQSETGYDAVSFQDVLVDSLTEPQVLQMRIKASKTDPFRMGVDIFMGKTNCTL